MQWCCGAISTSLQDTDQQAFARWGITFRLVAGKSKIVKGSPDQRQRCSSEEAHGADIRKDKAR